MLITSSVMALRWDRNASLGREGGSCIAPPGRRFRRAGAGMRLQRWDAVLGELAAASRSASHGRTGERYAVDGLVAAAPKQAERAEGAQDLLEGTSEGTSEGPRGLAAQVTLLSS